MKVKFESTRSKFKKEFFGIRCIEDVWFTKDGWISGVGINNSTYSNYEMCRSFKAAIRKIKRAKHGKNFVLTHRFIGYDVRISK